MEILSLLAENARRPFSVIGEEVGLSGPAVSDRVTRLQETGVINHFTIDVDRTKLRAGVPVLVQLDLPSESFDAVRERVRNDDSLETGDYSSVRKCRQTRIRGLYRTGTVRSYLVLR
nr:Lrp/AsnC family transcriptional regulator [Haloarchaeobius litoreus]